MLGGALLGAVIVLLRTRRRTESLHVELAIAKALKKKPEELSAEITAKGSLPRATG